MQSPNIENNYQVSKIERGKVFRITKLSSKPRNSINPSKELELNALFSFLSFFIMLRFFSFARFKWIIYISVYPNIGDQNI